MVADGSGHRPLAIGARRLLVMLAVVAGATLTYGITTIHPTNRPCPPGGQVAAPTVVQLAPNLVRHQNWVSVPSGQVTLDTRMVACADDRVVGEGIVNEGDLLTPETPVTVATHWVNWLWITGELERYQDPSAWRVVWWPAEQADRP